MITKKRIKTPLYPCVIEVVIYDDIEEVRSFRPERKNFFCFCDSPDDGFIRVGVNSKADSGNIAHECHHIKSYIWEYIGYTPTADNDEVDSYLIMWITRNVTHLFDKHNNSKK